MRKMGAGLPVKDERGMGGHGGANSWNRDEIQGKKSRVSDIIHTGFGNELACLLRIWLEFTP